MQKQYILTLPDLLNAKVTILAHKLNTDIAGVLERAITLLDIAANSDKVIVVNDSSEKEIVVK